MTIALVGLEFRPLPVPASLDAPDATDFIEMVRVRNQTYREISGHDDHRIAPDELLPMYRVNDDQRRIMWTIVVDSAVVGRVGVDLPLQRGSKVANWMIELLPDLWGRGIGSAAYELVERTARENGRSVLQSWAEHPDASGSRLVPPTGFGSIPEDHAARFYRRHGYTLEQIERSSALDLREPPTAIEQLMAAAQAAAADYEVVQWFLPTPAEFAEGYAWMKSRMATDAPAADLEFDEEDWDAARVARHDAQYTESGRAMQVTAARHIGTGELCAFNELVIGNDRTEASHQEDTLVLKEHRGHRLGTLVKCAGLLTWRAFAPESPRVITYNAEENRPMLDINEAIGFVPIAYDGAWKKVLHD
jgi:GNAT superfamily N-acetyltransferase